MGNMSYCRFENTVSDLGDCQLALEDLLMGDSNPLSDRELNKARELISTCADILALVQEQSGMDRREFLNKMDNDPKETINQILNNAQEHVRGL
jgi:hypothetical protein